jgi:hypothetical protein
MRLRVHFSFFLFLTLVNVVKAKGRATAGPQRITSWHTPISWTAELLSYCKCCSTASVVPPQIFFYCECCFTESIVLLQVLSYCKCCPTASVVLVQVLSCCKCCPTASVVLLQVLSYSKCCPTASVVLLQLLPYCKCCHTASFVLLQFCHTAWLWMTLHDFVWLWVTRQGGPHWGVRLFEVRLVVCVSFS